MQIHIETDVANHGGGQYPPKRIDGSPWAIVGATGWSWWEIANNWHIAHLLRPWTRYVNGEPDGRDWLFLALDDTKEKRYAKSFDVHLDSDDPNHIPVTPGAFYPIPGAKKLAASYNAPFTRNMRWRMRRAVNYESISEVMDPHYRARDLMDLAKQIRDGADDIIAVGPFDWSPSGTIYENGKPKYRGVNRDLINGVNQ